MVQRSLTLNLMELPLGAPVLRGRSYELVALLPAPAEKDVLLRVEQLDGDASDVDFHVGPIRICAGYSGGSTLLEVMDRCRGPEAEDAAARGRHVQPPGSRRRRGPRRGARRRRAQDRGGAAPGGPGFPDRRRLVNALSVFWRSRTRIVAGVVLSVVGIPVGLGAAFLFGLGFALPVSLGLLAVGIGLVIEPPPAPPASGSGPK